MSSPEVFPGRPRVAVPCGCELGEGVLWDGRTGTLLWVDIKNRTLFSWQPAGPDEPRRIRLGAPIGFAVLTPDPDIVIVGLKSELARLDLRDEATTMLSVPEPDEPGNRLNDGCAGPDGSLYFGTMDDAEARPSGTFHHWSRAGLARFGVRAVVTNGPAIDPTRGLLYASDTVAGRIHRHVLGPDGVPGEPETFVVFQSGWGHPDGMAVDAAGHVWVCHFGGSRVTRFTPDGVPVLVLPVPTAQVTKVAFGGPELTTLYLTTAAIGHDRETDLLAGHVLSVDVGIPGLPAGICTVVP